MNQSLYGQLVTKMKAPVNFAGAIAFGGHTFTHAQIWDDSPEARARWPSVFERYHPLKDGAMMQDLIWYFYPIAENVTIPCVSADGQRWLVFRDPITNIGRGDEANINQMEKSFTGIGWIVEGTGGPWLFPCDAQLTLQGDTIAYDQYFVSMHWATRIQGGERAWKKDEKMENATVQMALLRGLKGCTVFRNRMPLVTRGYLQSLGNKTSTIATATTVLEIIKNSAACDAAFERQKLGNSWSSKSLSQGQLEEKSRVHKLFSQTYGDLIPCLKMLGSCTTELSRYHHLVTSPRATLLGMTCWRG